MKKILPILQILISIFVVSQMFDSIIAFIGGAILLLGLGFFAFGHTLKDPKTGELQPTKKIKTYGWVACIFGFVIFAMGTDKIVETPAQKAVKEQKIKAEAKIKEQQEKLAKAFSVYDGSCPALEKAIKEGMNDPDSYDHVSTKAFDKTGYYYVITKFRGKNKFGGVITTTVTANISYEGAVIKILDQY